jgi:hypothetical protein
MPDVVIMALTGQKSAEVMAKYSHIPQVIDFIKTLKMIESPDRNTNEV